MTDAQQNGSSAIVDDDRIDIAEIAKRLWWGKNDILFCTSLALIMGVFLLHFVTKYYTATLVLVPTQSGTQSSLSQFSGIASLAGINLANLGRSGEPFTYYQNTLKSSAVAEDLVHSDPKILHHLFRAQWDEKAHKWVPPHGLLHAIVVTVRRILTGERANWQAPGPVQLRSLIALRVSAVEDIKNPILTVTYRDPNPVFAVQFLTKLNKSTDRVLRRMMLDRAEQYADYLEKKLPTVQLSDLKQVLVQSLASQETIIMMGNSNAPFAAQSLGPAVSSQQPTTPSAAAVLILSVFIGAAIGGIGVYFGLSPITGLKNSVGKASAFIQGVATASRTE